MRRLPFACLLAGSLLMAGLVAGGPVAAAPTAEPYRDDVLVTGSPVIAFGDAASMRGLTGLGGQPPAVGMAVRPGGGTYVALADGGIYAYSPAPFLGNAFGRTQTSIVAFAMTSSGNGYWLAAADGTVFAFGDAVGGNEAITGLQAPVTDMDTTPTGRGYWLTASDGGVFAFGDADFYGSAATLPLNAPIVAIAATPSGHGYRLLGRDGGVFAYGDASFLGSLAYYGPLGLGVNAPFVDIVSTASGNGYWLTGEDGGVFAFGDAPFYGSGAGATMGRMIRMIPTATRAGYWLITDDRCDPPGMSSDDSVKSVPPVPGSGFTFAIDDIAIGPPSCVTRFVITLADTNRGVLQWQAGYRPQPLGTNASPVRVSGTAALVIELNATVGAYAGPTAFDSTPYIVKEVREAASSPYASTWVLGIDRMRPFRVTELWNPHRVVVEVLTNDGGPFIGSSGGFDPYYVSNGRLVYRNGFPVLAAPSPEPLRAAVEYLLQPPSYNQWDRFFFSNPVTTTIPAGVTVIQTSRRPDDVAIVDLSPAFATGADATTMHARIGQVVLTVLSLGGYSGVQVSVDGQTLDRFGRASGDVVLGRGDFADIG